MNISKKIKFRASIRVNGERITKVFERKTDANDWYIQMKAQKNKHKALGISVNDSITLKEFCAIWIEQKKIDLERRSIDSYQSTINSRLLPLMGNLRLRDFNFNVAMNFKQKVSMLNLTLVRKNFIIRVFKQLFFSAIKWNYIAHNPIANLDQFKVKPRSITYWSEFEANKFLKCNLNSPFYHLYIVALNTGMRKCELLGLRWDKVDFKNNTIEICRIKDRYGLKNGTKTNTIRHIPMNNICKNSLIALFTARKDDGYIFKNPDGSEIGYMHFSDRIFKCDVERASVKTIRFHDLRTTFASNYVQNGGDIFTLSKILGHSSVVMTEKRYAHLSPNFLKKDVNILEIGTHKNNGTFLAHDNFSEVN